MLGQEEASRDLQVWQSSEGGCSEAKREGASCPVSMVSMVSFLAALGPAMHSSCAGGDRQAAMLPTTPDLLQLLRSMCLNAKVTRPSVFEALWGTAAPALAGAGSLAASVLGSRQQIIPRLASTLILRKQELKI